MAEVLDVNHLIGGEDVASESGLTFERKSPVTGNVVTKAAAGKAVDVDRAVVAADAAFDAWSTTGPNARRSILNACADA